MKKRKQKDYGSTRRWFGGIDSRCQPKLLGNEGAEPSLNQSVFAQAMGSLSIPRNRAGSGKLGTTDERISMFAPVHLFFQRIAFPHSVARISKNVSVVGVEHLLITGIETPICVYLSAVDALRRA